MYEVVFDKTPNEPCILSPNYKSFLACLECLTAHETRYCDGTLEPSWELCSRHQKKLEDEEFTLDEDMLAHLRENVYYGHIPKPEATKIRFYDPEHHGGPRIKYETSELWPKPMISFAHNKCIFSDNPDWKTGNIITEVSDSDSITKSPMLPSQPATTEPSPCKSKDLTLTTTLVSEIQALLIESLLSTQQGKSPTLNEQITTLEKKYEQPPITNISHSLFFKRCNGTYANATGETYKPRIHTQQHQYKHILDQVLEHPTIQPSSSNEDTYDYDDDAAAAAAEHDLLIAAAIAEETQVMTERYASTPKIPFEFQLRREKMIRDEIVDRDSLAITMFALNHQVVLPDVSDPEPVGRPLTLLNLELAGEIKEEVKENARDDFGLYGL